jgi:hypothetical protein
LTQSGHYGSLNDCAGTHVRHFQRAKLSSYSTLF